MTVNFDVGYFCNVIEHSVGVVVCTTKCDVFHEDLVKRGGFDLKALWGDGER